LIIWELKERTMEWTSPQFEEICLNCEINSYASAEL
jgi:coenzyme PQQ precursor peptide PqqA